jgi:hypothetical protein
MDGGGRAASGTAAESNAGRYGLLPSRGIRTSVCIRANCRDVQMSTIFSFLLSMASVHPCTARKACDRHDCMDAGGRVTHGTVTEGWRKVVQCRPLRAPALTRHSHVRVHQSKLPRRTNVGHLQLPAFDGIRTSMYSTEGSDRQGWRKVEQCRSNCRDAGSGLPLGTPVFS